MQVDGILEASRLLGEKLRTEDGVGVAVNRIISLLDDQNA